MPIKVISRDVPAAPAPMLGRSWQILADADG